MAYVRFPVPDFDYQQFKKMAWREPAYLADADVARLIAAQKRGDAAAWGAYPVKPADALFDRLAIRGDRRHAVMCVLPDKPVSVVGRSRAWFIQRAVALDSSDPDAAKEIFDWRTTRPVSTTLGPTTGTTVAGGIVHIFCCRRYGDHWIGNRTILDNDWKKGRGFRILSARDDGGEDFHEICLNFEWEA